MGNLQKTIILCMRFMKNIIQRATNSWSLPSNSELKRAD